MRKNGERFAVMIYEASLVDGQGQHAGWMSAVLDVSAQRRIEDVVRNAPAWLLPVIFLTGHCDVPAAVAAVKSAVVLANRLRDADA